MNLGLSVLAESRDLVMQKPGFSRKEFLKLAGIALTGGILAACSPNPTEPFERTSSATETAEAIDTVPQLPTETRAPNPTATLLPTHTEIPPAASPTITVTPTAENPRPEEEDILTESQKTRLAESALKYEVDTEPDAILVARSLEYLHNDGHPASVCGPLAMAILRDASLVSKYVDLHDYWLLNPRDSKNLKILERTFPKEEFLWFKSSESTALFDFTDFPLKAGDFLYLYAGDPGSFEHMLTVSRVDEAGRAFAVTNFDTPEGYVIQEVMLYDPGQPGVGKFYDWTNRKNYRYGLTGFGGFDLWRFAMPVPEMGVQELALAEAIDGVIKKHGGKWYLLIKEVSKNNLYARKIREPVHPASVIKVPIAMIFFTWLAKQYPQGIAEGLKFGCDGRSYEQLLRAMLVDSEEKATESILNELERFKVNAVKILEDWGAATIDVVQRIATAHDMAMLFEGLYDSFLTEDAREFMLEALQVYSPGDDTRWGALRKQLPEGYHFYNKRGTITDGILVMADYAIVECPTSSGKRTFILGAFAFKGEQETIYEDLVGAIEAMALLFWDYVQQL
jgi:hypothetical protein